MTVAELAAQVETIRAELAARLDALAAAVRRAATDAGYAASLDEPEPEDE